MHPKVREAVVAGVPDAYRGETVKAFVVLKPGETATEEEIVEFCRLHLAAFKVPRKVEFRDRAAEVDGGEVPAARPGRGGAGAEGARPVTAADERPWVRHYEEGVPSTIAVPDVTLPELLDRTAARAPGQVALRFFLDPRLPVPTLTWAELRERTPALRDRPLPARGAQGRPGGDHAAELPGVRGRLLRRPAHRRDPGQHEPDVRRARDARAARDSGSETLVLLDQFFPRLREIHAATRVRRAIVVDVTENLPWPARTLARLAQSRRGERAAGPRRDGRLLLPRAPPRVPADASRGEPPADATWPSCSTPAARPARPRARCSPTATSSPTRLQARSWFPRLRDGARGDPRRRAPLPRLRPPQRPPPRRRGGGRDRAVPRPRPSTPCSRRSTASAPRSSRACPRSTPGSSTTRGWASTTCAPARSASPARPRCPRASWSASRRSPAGRLVEGYGLTETSPLTHGNPIHGERRVGSIGVPVPGTDARIVDLATGEPLPPGREGELEVRGPQVMLGYWNRPAETAEMMHDGWLRTGDICRMDEDGWFYVVDRRKDMIDASGFKVFPREVEEVLLMHPAVREAVVAGVPDAYRGRDGEGLRRPAAGAAGERRGDRRLLPAAPRRVQDPAAGRVPGRAAEVDGGEVPEARPRRGGASAGSARSVAGQRGRRRWRESRSR